MAQQINAASDATADWLEFAEWLRLEFEFVSLVKWCNHHPDAPNAEHWSRTDKMKGVGDLQHELVRGMLARPVETDRQRAMLVAIAVSAAEKGWHEHTFELGELCDDNECPYETLTARVLQLTVRDIIARGVLPEVPFNFDGGGVR
jgi:hypothetical protein